MSPEERFAEQIAEAKTKLEAKNAENRGTTAAEPADSVSVEPEQTEDPYLKEALSMGYNPNYEGANKKTPEQFVKDGSFFKKIDSLNKKLESVETLVQDLTAANTKIADENYKKGLEDALKKRHEAVQAGDVEAFHKAEQDLAKAQQRQAVAPKPAMSDVEKQWVEENKAWFNQETKENKEMTLLAVEYGKFIEANNPGITAKELLKEVADTIKAIPKYSHRFQEAKKESAPAVGKSTVSGTASKSSSNLAARLTSQQKEIFERTKHMHSKGFTLEQYAKALNATGKLSNE